MDTTTSEDKTKETKETVRIGNAEIAKILDSISSKIDSKTKINLVCYVYDQMCVSHVPLPVTDSDGVTRHHQESKHRVQKINGALHITGLSSIFITGGSIEMKRSDLHRVHTPEYIKQIENLCKLDRPGKLDPPSSETSVSGFKSLESIYAAAASVMGGINMICADRPISTAILKESYAKQNKTKPVYRSNVPRRVFCNVRPPGHHAHTNHGAGFCFLNNIAIGAKYAQAKYPHIKKILIVDWDLHHGDGTQDVFKGNPDVLYVSLHRGTDFYPGTGSATDNELYPNILNVPLKANTTIEEYMAHFNGEVMQKAYAFKPDLIIVSAGFDSHKDDTYHELPLDYKDYSYMTRCIIDLAETYAHGRIVSVLEGGYNINVLIGSVVSHIATMIDYDGVIRLE